jgi:tetratricopeptide (TPR) repeat protein
MGPPRGLGITFALLVMWPAWGQPPRAPSEPYVSDAERANAYFRDGNVVGALPLYDRLAAEQPNDPRLAERLAACLYSQLSTLPAGEQRSALLARAKSEAERAKSLGDHSYLLQLILAIVTNPGAAQNHRSEMLNGAEAAFNRGDMDGALERYVAIAASDPESYEARLFAGDVYFRKRAAREAGVWFQKAIEVNPDRETAYRYWGDALAAAGEKDAALQKFIAAIVAEPYGRSSWFGLSQWARANAVTLTAPRVPVPEAPTVEGEDKPKVTIFLDMQDPTKPAGVLAAWLAYSSNRALWQTERFAKRFPTEKTYRHSLAEEAESLRLVLTVLQETKTSTRDLDDESVRDLVELGKDGMIEPYILLSASDSGIQVDYPAYRASHRDQLHAYLEKYVVRR